MQGGWVVAGLVCVCVRVCVCVCVSFFFFFLGGGVSGRPDRLKTSKELIPKHAWACSSPLVVLMQGPFYPQGPCQQYSDSKRFRVPASDKP